MASRRPPADEARSTTFGQRVQELVDRYAGGSLTEFSEQVGVGRRTLLKVISGEVSNPGVNLATRLLERFEGVDAGWLMTGKAPTGEVRRAAVQAEAVQLLSEFVAGVRKAG